MAASDNLRDVEMELSADPILTAVAGEWPAFSREVNAQLAETSRLILSHPSLDTLRHQERTLVRLTQTIDDWNRDLTERGVQLDKKLKQLERAGATWSLTLETAGGGDTPVQVLENIRNTIAGIGATQEHLRVAERSLLSLQNRLTQDDRRLDSAIDSLKQARTRILNHLAKRDSPPVWDHHLGTTDAPTASAAETESSLVSQLAGLWAYSRRETGSFLLTLLMVGFFVLAAHWLRRSLAAALDRAPTLQRATVIFNSPTSIGIVLAMAASAWVFPAPPRILKALLAAIAVVPASFILRRLVGRHFRPVPIVLLVFFFADHLRSVMAGSPLLSRGALLGETTAALVAAVWFRSRLGRGRARRRDRVRRAVMDAGLVVLVVALGANVLGFLNLATLLANAVLNSAYAAVVLFALSRIAAVLVMGFLHVPPFSRLRMVHLRRRTLWRGSMYAVGWLTAIAWLAYTLERFAVAELLWGWGTAVLTAPLKVGALSITLGNIVSFALTLWAAILLSRAARFVLEEEVYVHLRLPSGLPYAISKTLHYVILTGGFLAAVAALGFDMTKFTILVSAFGVGLGFGMQNILNNFASGLILLFERPVKVGDVIQIDDATGVIERIGIRATVLRTGNGAEVILPNGKLISDRVTNWTFGSRQRIVQVPVTVPTDTDPTHVVALLKTVAAADPRVSASPAPQAVVTNLGAGGYEFELRVWTPDIDNVIQLKSDLAVAANAAIQKEKAPKSGPVASGGRTAGPG
ncbi:MAG: mechanosensitive ion channel [Elusimicrobia bacterium]|nr:mechanosensitive ion channel [Elusimicrobiota bacterium]